MKILLVDDSTVIRRLQRRWIEAVSDSLIDGVESGEAALRLIRHSQKPYDLIICDINLTGMSGIETVREIRKLPNTQSIQIMMCSSMAADYVKHEAFEAGADDFLAKPFRQEDFLKRLCSYFSIKIIGEISNDDAFRLNDTCPVFLSDLTNR